MTQATPGTLARPIGADNSDEIIAAFPKDGSVPDRAIRLSLMRQLHEHYTAYLGGAQDFAEIPRLNCDAQFTEVEDSWLRWEDAQVDKDRLPRSAEELAGWFESLWRRHVQPAFCRYLAEEATLDEIAIFILAEELVDSRFDDLVALAQIGATGASKMTMAENYWDEMGEGNLDRMHSRLFEHSAQYMRRRLANHGISTAELGTMEVYQNANLVLMYGIQRRLAPRALAALGLMESSAPARFQAMVDGCTRHGVPADVIEYQRIHIDVDTGHGSEWLGDVLVPLARRSPRALREIGMGALTRERVANAYYERVWQQMRAVRQRGTRHGT
jgi:Iron-containing redox enzyme